ncbi:hypothetical protein [Acetivibrio saccincola]|jgi:hypothetical protein|uniref:Uncharacterized protein n=1 Tax=Acetivibrio saccincola TaxID=1677857 RepID=A0A2K9E6A8_9FIRM|nr:hypothetical protein [Acetivibrio saccincola]AUG56996.1 hypothetical protein HVS_05325 [Acetivibrio saccincola]NLW26237.1 hypothetical protein [Acetivibrio saccincola]PQQ67014.1 hypothetical protein B9R14_09875 [Acetivibrio saccincola]HOA97498.1 hypothetical protein [Acetivibrio saccincola]HQD27985.1 hypothetical protein [Acetivibrio saccincola]
MSGTFVSKSSESELSSILSSKSSLMSSVVLFDCPGGAVTSSETVSPVFWLSVPGDLGSSLLASTINLLPDESLLETFLAELFFSLLIEKDTIKEVTVINIIVKAKIIFFLNLTLYSNFFITTLMYTVEIVYISTDGIHIIPPFKLYYL